ncbi:hypothetical protein BGX24_009509 [Mortierella sp. AD032]|nr:hypothetical protein BGX24_009509 [Mortierella sp. AD032]
MIRQASLAKRPGYAESDQNDKPATDTNNSRNAKKPCLQGMGSFNFIAPTAVQSPGVDIENTTTNDAAGDSLSPFRPHLAASVSVTPSTTTQSPVWDCPAQGSLSINGASTLASKGIPTSTFFSEYTELCASPTPKRRRYNREADVEENEEASMIQAA